MSSDRKSPEAKAALDVCPAVSKPSQGGTPHPEKQDGKNRHEAIAAPSHGVVNEHKEKGKIEPKPKGPYYQDGSTTTKTSHEGEKSVPQQKS